MRRLLSVFLGLLLPAPALAQRSLVIERFDSDIRVQADGDVFVNETLRVRFSGSWNGVYRVLSLQHENAEGGAELLRVDLIGATDDAGNTLKVDSRRRRNDIRWQVWVPDANDAVRTFTLRYVVHNAIRFFDADTARAYEELYWNVNGNDWEVPIEGIGARVTLPDGVVPLQSAAYTGRAGSKASDATIRTSGNVVEFRATRALDPGETLTVATGWPAGAVARPPAPPPLLLALTGWWPTVLPLFAFLFAFRAWLRTGRDPEPHAITVQYEPAPGLTPTEVGTIIDHQAEMQDITAAIVDLAVRGWLRIEEREEKKLLGLFSNTEYVFCSLRSREGWDTLAPHETLLLTALFDNAKATTDPSSGLESVKLSDLKNSFYKSLTGIRNAVYERLIAKGFYRKNPQTVKAHWMLGGAAGLGLGIGGSGYVASSALLGIDPVSVVVGGIGSAIILFIFGAIMPARTEAGARSREHALGFKEFLSKVDSDRFRRMITSPEMFEKYLPYAMAFKVEDRWAKAFEGIFTEPPSWYVGPHGGTFSPTGFTHSLGTMSTAASSAMSSSPSGSGGGGSAGGGSGGGGGGGF